jgi:hypothetical protein
MALSNWDTLSLDEDSKPTNGVICSKLGIYVEIHKNWLYVRDDKAWVQEGGFRKPTVMQIYEGDIIYKDVRILAERGPQEGIYCFVHTTTSKEPVSVMVGIGCYGYDSHSDWVGVTAGSLYYLKSLCTNKWAINLWEENLETILKTLDFSQALRFNQGDEFFSTAFGEAIPATKVGKAEKSVVEKALGK